MVNEHLSWIQDACNDHGAGFHFEEGGCWGMALALSEDLQRVGVAHQVMVRTDGFAHAMIEIDGALYDYKGLCVNQSFDVLTPVSDLQALVSLAKEFGASDDDLQRDRAWAATIIGSARRLALSDGREHLK